jgi:hypothetical protein
MDALLTAASLATAAIGTGCCVARRHTGYPAVAGMATMLVAMADTMLFDGVLLASRVWAAVLVVVGAAGLVALHLTEARSPLRVLRTPHLTVLRAHCTRIGDRHLLIAVGGSRRCVRRCGSWATHSAPAPDPLMPGLGGPRSVASCRPRTSPTRPSC